jgi:RND family efflux transporter MFP subunit
MRISKKGVATFLVLSCIAAGAAYQIHQAYQRKAVADTQGKKGGTGRMVTVTLNRARTGMINEEILITGALRPKEQVDVMPQATGRITSLRWQVGDAVRKGELVAELEDAEPRQQVNRARAALEVTRASLAQRRAELANAKADIRRAQNLHEEKLIARQEFESRQTAFRVVEAQVQFTLAQERQAQAELNELEIRLAQSKIYAPMDGVIAKRYVDVGALVNPSNPIVNLVNMATMVTMANVPEREVGKLRVGSRALVQVDAYGDQRFTGRIARIAPVLDAATRTATVEVEIPNSTGGLKAEMFARVTIDLASQRAAVLIPREALVYRGQQAGVYVMQDKRPVFRTVETGLTRGDDVEVLANLQAGATIVTRGATMLNEGDQIRIAPMSERRTAADTNTQLTNN